MKSPEIQDTPSAALGLSEPTRLELIELLGRVRSLLGASAAVADLGKAIGGVAKALGPVPVAPMAASASIPAAVRDRMRCVLVSFRHDVKRLEESLVEQERLMRHDEMQLDKLRHDIQEITTFLGDEVAA